MNLKVRPMRKTRTRATAFVALATGLLVARPAAVRPAEPSLLWEAQLKQEVADQIEEWNQELAEYRAAYRLELEHEPFIESLLMDEPFQTGPLELEENAEFVIFALCDEDCLDIDLYLLNDENEVVDSDTAEDALPVLELSTGDTEGASLPYVAELVMIRCQAKTCFFAMAVCRRVESTESPSATGAEDADGP